MWGEMTAFLLVPKWIMTAIRLQRGEHLPRETGGFLIGERRGPHIQVTGLTKQGRGDIATCTSFERSCSSHRDAVHHAWRRSDGMQSLVGDWHSHPCGSADASSTDVSAWRTLARTSRKPIIGLIDAGGLPKAYFAAETNRPFATLLEVEEEALDHYAYVIPTVRRANMLTRLVPQAFIR
jgi:integrative and conjugative element protein (TIGR02256 family)